MSFLFKPSGGGITGTAVDPVGPGGVLIDPGEITQPGFAPPGAPAGHIMFSDGAGGWTIGPNPGGGLPDNRLQFQMHHNNGVPGGAGQRFLRYGQNVICSVTGFRLAVAGRLRGITIQVGSASANTYVVEILKNPTGRAGATSVLGTLTLAPAALGNEISGLSVPVTLADELGARVVRTVGAGGGLGQISVGVEFSTP